MGLGARERARGVVTRGVENIYKRGGEKKKSTDSVFCRISVVSNLLI